MSDIRDVVSFLDRLLPWRANGEVLARIAALAQGQEWAAQLLERQVVGVSELTSAVEDLRTAVTGVAARVGDLVGPLQEQLDEARAALVEFQSSDAAEDSAYEATITDLTARIQAGLDAAAQAATQIQGEVTRLNDVAGSAGEEPIEEPVDPSEPVDPVEPPVEEPVDPTDPVIDPQEPVEPDPSPAPPADPENRL